MGGGKSSISAYVTNNDYYNKVYGSIDKALLHTTTYNGFAERVYYRNRSNKYFN